MLEDVLRCVAVFFIKAVLVTCDNTQTHLSPEVKALITLCFMTTFFLVS